MQSPERSRLAEVESKALGARAFKCDDFAVIDHGNMSGSPTARQRRAQGPEDGLAAGLSPAKLIGAIGIVSSRNSIEIQNLSAKGRQKIIAGGWSTQQKIVVEIEKPARET